MQTEPSVPTVMNLKLLNIMNTEKCIDVCNGLLRGERSAVETYQQAIEKYADEPAVATLRSIKEEHTGAVSLLEANVISMGGKPDEDSGAWGTFATTIQATANLFGESSALSSLKAGEESGKSDYESALENEDVMPACKELIRDSLLPPIYAHISTLDHLSE